MRRHAPARQVARPGSRGVQESAAGAAGAIHDGLRELLHVFGIVGAVVPIVINESRPPAPNSDDAVPFAQRADRDRPDRRIETGDVATAGENRDCLVARHASKTIVDAGRLSKQISLIFTRHRTRGAASFIHPAMNATGNIRWVRAALLVGVLYLVAGLGFGELARLASSNQVREAWRLAAWVVSAAAFAAQIGYEHFRLRSSPGAT